MEGPLWWGVGVRGAVGWGDRTQVHRQLERVGVYSQRQGSGWTSLCGDLLKTGSRGGTVWGFCPNQPKRIPVEGRPGWWALPGGWRELGPTRYWGWEVLVKLAEKDSCWNWALQKALESGLDYEEFQGVLRVLGQWFLMLSDAAPGSRSQWSSHLPLLSLLPLPLLPAAGQQSQLQDPSSALLTTWVLLQKYCSVDFKGLPCMSHELIQFFIVINTDGKT